MFHSWQDAKGDLLKLRYIAQLEYPELEDSHEERWRAACRWSVGRKAPCLVHCTRCKPPIAQAFQSPYGTLVAVRLRNSDVDGYCSVNGRRLPLDVVASSGLLAPPPATFVPEPLDWVTDVLPYPAPIPQPTTMRARCSHGVHVIVLHDLRQLLGAAILAHRTGRIRSTPTHSR